MFSWFWVKEIMGPNKQKIPKQNKLTSMFQEVGALGRQKCEATKIAYLSRLAACLSIITSRSSHTVSDNPKLPCQRFSHSQLFPHTLTFALKSSSASIQSYKHSFLTSLFWIITDTLWKWYSSYFSNLNKLSFVQPTSISSGLLCQQSTQD